MHFTSRYSKSKLFFQLVNIFLLAASSNLLVTAETPNLSILHGDRWVQNLKTWSTVGICVAVLHTIFIFSFCFCSDVPEGVSHFHFTTFICLQQHCFCLSQSAKLRNQRIAICLVELVAIALVLTGLVMPGIDQWPEQYTETDLAMYAAIAFIVPNIIIAFLVGRAACRYKAPQPANELHQTNVQIQVIEIRTTNWVIGLF